MDLLFFVIDKLNLFLIRLLKFCFSNNNPYVDKLCSFFEACNNNELDEAKKIIREYPNINISKHYNFFFTKAFLEGHFKLAKWILSLDNKNSISIYKYCYFHLCNINDKTKSTKLIYKLNNLFDSQAELIIFYKDTIVEKKINNCCICYEESNVKTNCGHYGCEECFEKLDILGHNNCPICRRTIEYLNKIKNE
jgi:hypothetical protein